MTKRVHQLLLIATFVPLCWLTMQAVHELGHVVFAVVAKVVLHPLRRCPANSYPIDVLLCGWIS